MSLQEKISMLAELAVKIGVNVQKGDIVEVQTPVERVNLAREVVQKAYDAGAKKVIVTYFDDEVKLLNYTYAPVEALNVPDYEYEKYETLLKNDLKQIFIKAVDPELLKDVDPNKIAKVEQARATKMQPLKNFRMNDITSWTIISAPTERWAKKVFPNSENPVDDLWEAIF
ncbi:hypothetical protein HMPREF9709_00288, partial [Helcococcus kunzii ATCC 51366]